jgi:hypothetical protein
MMRFSIILAVGVSLSGCVSAVPVTQKFPDAPLELMVPPEPLTPISKNKKQLSDLIGNANKNYGKYHDLADRYAAWQRWYDEQRKIFEEIKE